MKISEINEDLFVSFFGFLIIIGLVLLGIGALINGDTYTIIDNKENVILDSKINTIKHLGKGLYIIENNNSEDLKQIISGKFKIGKDSVLYDCELIENGFLITANNDNNWSIYNIYTGFSFDIQSEEKPFIGENIFLYKKDDLWGIMDFSGKSILNNVYNDCGYIFKNVIPLQLNGKWGFFDDSGNRISDFIYDGFRLPLENKIGVKINDKWGFINTSGQLILNPIYDNVLYYINGLCAVCKNNKWGFIDSTFNQVIDFRYDEVGFFPHNIAPAKIGKKWGFVNNAGQDIIDYEFIEQSQSFNINKDYAAVKIKKRGNNWNVINRKGELILSKNYSEIFIMNTPRFLVKRESLVYHIGLILFGISILGFIISSFLFGNIDKLQKPKKISEKEILKKINAGENITFKELEDSIEELFSDKKESQ